jgi:hypothetical protein
MVQFLAKAENFLITNVSRLNMGPPSLLFGVVLGSLSAGRCEQNAEFPIHLCKAVGLEWMKFYTNKKVKLSP